jgi:hypothetical protein
MARSRPKMAPDVVLRKHLTMIPLVFEIKMREIIKYALVRLNAKKRVLKAGRPNQDLDIY